MNKLEEASVRIDEALNTERSGLREKMSKLDKDIDQATKEKLVAQEDGDLRENYPYIVASEKLARCYTEKGRVYNKIKAFDKFNQAYASEEFVGIGTTVELEDMEGHERYIIKIVPADLGNSTIGAVSIESPVGQVILGKQAGDSIVVKTQARTIDYKILQIL